MGQGCPQEIKKQGEAVPRKLKYRGSSREIEYRIANYYPKYINWGYVLGVEYESSTNWKCITCP